ncbi:hypothetical protein HBB04_05237 (plasmid) [Pseudomonas coronafaciens]|nr:hypothetical protein HBB04_05237 [Pseudomonas coronafaciens]
MSDVIYVTGITYVSYRPYSSSVESVMGSALDAFSSSAMRSALSSSWRAMIPARITSDLDMRKVRGKREILSICLLTSLEREKVVRTNVEAFLRLRLGSGVALTGAADMKASAASSLASDDGETVQPYESNLSIPFGIPPKLCCQRLYFFYSTCVGVAFQDGTTVFIRIVVDIAGCSNSVKRLNAEGAACLFGIQYRCI